MATAPETSNQSLFYQLLASRLFIGITCGIGPAPPGAYIGEISNPNIRGRLVLLPSIAFAFGIVVMYSLGYFIRVSNAEKFFDFFAFVFVYLLVWTLGLLAEKSISRHFNVVVLD